LKKILDKIEMMSQEISGVFKKRFQFTSKLFQFLTFLVPISPLEKLTFRMRIPFPTL
jgi:hypothetical protein